MSAEQPAPVADLDELVEHVARRHWEYGQGGTLTRTRPLPTQLPVPPGSGPTVTHRSEVSDMRRYWD